MKDFNGRVAAITGAGSGIGRALALQLAQAGCGLSLSDVNESGLAETAAQITSASPAVQVTTSCVDVADRQAVFDWAQDTVQQHAGVNLIVNNAGVALGATVEGTTIEDFEWVMKINFWGVVHGTQAFLPHLKATGDGHVVNISSLFGLVALPTQAAYNASKFAVRGFTESLRQELDLLRCGVSATSVHPGGVKTAIAQSGRADLSVGALGIDPESVASQAERYLVTTAERASSRIPQAVRRNRRRVLIGSDAVLMDKVQRLVPGAYQRLTADFIRRQRKAQA